MNSNTHSLTSVTESPAKRKRIHSAKERRQKATPDRQRQTASSANSTAMHSQGPMTMSNQQLQGNTYFPPMTPVINEKTHRVGSMTQLHQKGPVQAVHPFPFFPMVPPPQGFLTDTISQYLQQPPPLGLHGADCSCNQQVLQLQAKVQLLERKIKAKDQLFDDSLSSSFAACGATQGSEYNILINKLKKRVINLKARNDQCEEEIKRLTKTVRVVEVEVSESNEPLKNEIARLHSVIDQLQSQLDTAAGQLDAANRLKIQMQKTIDDMTAVQQKNLLQIEELKLKLQNTQTNLKETSEELRLSKDANKDLEKKIKMLEGKLAQKKLKNKSLKLELKSLKDRTDQEISKLEKGHLKDVERIEELQLQMREISAEFMKRIKDLEFKLERAQQKERSSSSSSSSSGDKDKVKDAKKKLKSLEEENSKHESTIKELKQRLEEKETIIKNFQSTSVTIKEERVVEKIVYVDREKDKPETPQKRLKSSSSNSSSPSSSQNSKEKKHKKEKKTSSSIDKEDVKELLEDLQKQLKAARETLEKSESQKIVLQEKVTVLEQRQELELKKLQSQYKDKILRLEAEIEELYGELEQEELDDEKLATDALATTANAALAKKKAEDLRLRQGKEIRELIEQLNHSTKENVKTETSLAVIMQKNNELIKSHNTSVKIVDKFVKVERLVPQIIDRVVQVDKIVEKESLEMRTKLWEEERALLKREVRLEFSDQIQELEANILAYQDLLILKETEIKAYAMEITELQKQKAGLNEEQLIASLRKLLAEKQRQIEAFKSSDVMISGLPQRVYKKMEHINIEIQEKLEVVHKNYAKEIKHMSDRFLEEIEAIKKEKLKVEQSIPERLAELSKKYKVEIERLTMSLVNHQEAYKKKTAESNEFQARVRKLAEEIFDIKHHYEGLLLKHDLALQQQQEEFNEQTKHLNEQLAIQQQEHALLVQQHAKLTAVIQSSGDAQLLLQFETYKQKYAVDIEKWRAQILDYKNRCEQEQVQNERLKIELAQMARVQQRCEHLEQEHSQCAQERQKLMGQYNAMLETERAKYEACFLQQSQLNKQQQAEMQHALEQKTKECDQLLVQLEQLESSRSSDCELIEDIHRRYKLQLQVLTKECSDQKQRFNTYCKELSLKLQKAFSRTETQLLVEIERLKANERALVVEHEFTLQSRIKETRLEMQIVIDELSQQVSVLFEKIAQKDGEIRKLIIALEEWKEWKLKYEQLRVEMQLTIKQLKQDYDQRLAEVGEKLKRVTSEHEKLVREHAQCAEVIMRLEQRVKLLLAEIEELKNRSSSSSSSSSSKKLSERTYTEEEEKIEIVAVMQTHQEDLQQFRGETITTVQKQGADQALDMKKKDKKKK